MWITNNKIHNNKYSTLPVFCKSFYVNKDFDKCVIKISALGIFDLNINDRSIGDWFMPGWSNYNKYINICTYDISEFVKEQNFIAVTVANGWYSGRLGYTGKRNVYGNVNALYAEIIIYYKDGSITRFFTDESWYVCHSQIVESDFFDGEIINFNIPVLNTENALKALKYDCDIKFNDYDYEPVRQIATLIPEVICQEKDRIVLDFKQNFSGVISFTAKGNPETLITVKHSEMLNIDGTLYYDNLRSAKATDQIILSDGDINFCPKFTFHGFRYAEILISGEAKVENIKGVVLSQNIQYTGAFKCSDEIMNCIYQNVLWGQKSNFISIPTDCPQRDERLGWTGDAEVFCNTAMFNSDCKKFFENYMKLIRTDVLPDGKIPSFVPFFILVSESTAGVPGWQDAICVIPYYHYHHYKDKKVIIDNLSYMEKLIDYYLENSQNYFTNIKNPFGDWLSINEISDTKVVNQCFFGLSTKMVSEMCKLVGEKEKNIKYYALYEKVKEAFRENCFTEDGKILGDTQTAYVLAYSVGFVSKEEIKTPLLECIKKSDGKITTGFVGVKYLLPVLCDIGAADVAYKIAKQQDFPSWGYTIKHGATTIWERWNGYTEENGFESPKMNSFNHYSLGSCAEWFYSYVLGIKLSFDNKITVSPSFSRELKWAEGNYKSIFGNIYIKWIYVGDKIHMDIIADDKVEFDYDLKDLKVVSSKNENNKVSLILEV